MNFSFFNKMLFKRFHSFNSERSSLTLNSNWRNDNKVSATGKLTKEKNIEMFKKNLNEDDSSRPRILSGSETRQTSQL